MDQPDFGASAEAFEALSDPARVELLCRLWEEGRQSPVPFGTLKEAAGIADSGRFNYHLQRLVGPFVSKVEAGYRLTPAGLAVVDTVHSGMLSPAEDAAAAIDTACPDCGHALSFAYEDGYASVRCEDCSRTLSRLLFPPRGVAAREPESAARAFAVHTRSVLDRAVSGVCPYCAGRSRIESLADTGGVPEGRVTFAADCADCGGRVTVSAAALVSFEPAVVAFLHERGVETRGPLWEQQWFHEAGVTVTDPDAPAVEVTVPAGGDALAVTVEGGEVVAASEADGPA